MLRLVQVPDAITKLRTAAEHAAIGIRGLGTFLEKNKMPERRNAKRDADNPVPRFMIGLARRVKGSRPRHGGFGFQGLECRHDALAANACFCNGPSQKTSEWQARARHCPARTRRARGKL
jgi:hypothetical protein